ncbi:hypothetical protein G9A89_012815 [Geosiphon pyriformis]|nr:hypothetical protein G9A89_012815 [Geosiphon pyriformis]
MYSLLNDILERDMQSHYLLQTNPATFFSWPILQAPGFPLDISATLNQYILRAELPGIPIENIHVDVTPDENLIIITAERKEIEDENEKPIKVERIRGQISRQFKFPKGIVDLEHVKAEFGNGVLVVKVPKKERKGIRILKARL